jgi:hypothetical protein
VSAWAKGRASVSHGWRASAGVRGNLPADSLPMLQQVEWNPEDPEKGGVTLLHFDRALRRGSIRIFTLSRPAGRCRLQKKSAQALPGQMHGFQGIRSRN